MNILILTNTFTPHVGGVARSVEAFSAEYRKRGHRVLVVAPEFPDMPQRRNRRGAHPAIQNFNASDFSVALPIHPQLSRTGRCLPPDIVHSQHPFLLGITALRIARHRGLPLVFTHHTLYEQYTHYVPGDSPALKRFAIELATRYANLCDQVFAPSESIRELLQERGVTSPIAVVPTGVHLEHFARGTAAPFAGQMGIPEDAFVVGHLGRLAPEKNLEFLAQAVADFLSRHAACAFSGDRHRPLRRRPCGRSLPAPAWSAPAHRRHPAAAGAGRCPARDGCVRLRLQSETQGMVLTEAMAAGLPVVALDAAVYARWSGTAQRPPAARRHARRLQRRLAMGAPNCHRNGASCNRPHSPPPRPFPCPDRRTRPWPATKPSTQAQLAVGPQGRKWLGGCHDLRQNGVGYPEKPGRAGDAALGTPVSERKTDAVACVPIRRLGRRQGDSPCSAASRPGCGACAATSVAASGWRVCCVCPYRKGSPTRPGLIMIQIDGLSQPQFERALERGELPFLRRLISANTIRLHAHYSGLPATTPAVQAELFYGVKAPCRRSPSGIMRPGDRPHVRAGGGGARRGAAPARQRGLLEGGSAYSDNFTGGAAESHFCPSSMGWGRPCARPIRWCCWRFCSAISTASCVSRCCCCWSWGWRWWISCAAWCADTTSSRN
jgi:1,2-diacylglycerol 3-alpha-glucosyltransferase